MEQWLVRVFGEGSRRNNRNLMFEKKNVWLNFFLNEWVHQISDKSPKHLFNCNTRSSVDSPMKIVIHPPTIISTFTPDNALTILWSKRNKKTSTPALGTVQNSQTSTLLLLFFLSSFTFISNSFYGGHYSVYMQSMHPGMQQMEFICGNYLKSISLMGLVLCGESYGSVYICEDKSFKKTLIAFAVIIRFFLRSSC